MKADTLRFTTAPLTSWLDNEDRSRRFLARKSGISYPQLLRILSGQSIPTIVTAGRLARAIGVDVRDLLEG